MQARRQGMWLFALGAVACVVLIGLFGHIGAVDPDPQAVATARTGCLRDGGDVVGDKPPSRGPPRGHRTRSEPASDPVSQPGSQADNAPADGGALGGADDGGGEVPWVDTALIVGTPRTVRIDSWAALETRPTEHASGPVFSPSGDALAWEVWGPDGHRSVMVRTEGNWTEGTPLRIPGPNPSGWSEPVWLADGTLVVLGGLAGESKRLYRWRPSSSPPEPLTADTDVVGSLSDPAASNDGQWVAFVTDAHDSGAVKLREQGSGAIVDAPTSRGDDRAPAFDHDSARLVYQRVGEGLMVMDVATRRIVTVLDAPRAVRPAFAGERVVYFEPTTGLAGWMIKGVGMFDRAPVLLASGVRLPRRAGPAVSMDGAWVAYVHSDLAHTGSVTLVRVDGSDAVEIQTGKVDCDDPVLWSQNGHLWLAFTAVEPSGLGQRRLWVADVLPAL